MIPTNNYTSDRFEAALRSRVGHGRMSLKDFADAIFVCERTAENYRRGETLPDLATFARMCAVFGPSFAADVLPPPEARPCLHEFAADAAEHLAQHTEAGRDGVFDERETRGLWKSLQRLADKYGWNR